MCIKKLSSKIKHIKNLINYFLYTLRLLIFYLFSEKYLYKKQTLENLKNLSSFTKLIYKKQKQYSLIIKSKKNELYIDNQNSYIHDEINLYKLNNVYLVGETDLIIKNNIIYLPKLINEKNEFLNLELIGKLKYEYEYDSIKVLLKKQYIKKNEYIYFSLVGSATSNYAHWLLEHIGKLNIFLQKIFQAKYSYKNKTICILIDSFLHFNQIKQIHLLCKYHKVNYCFIKIKKFNKVFLDNVYYIPSLSYTPFHNKNLDINFHKSNKFSYKAYKDLTSKFKKIIKKNKSNKYPNKIFLIRNSSYRNITNYDEIKDIFLKNGFIFLDMEKLNFEDQFLYIQNAKEIAGPIGASFANIIFANENSRITFLGGYNKKINYNYFCELAHYSKLKFRYILGEQIISKDDVAHRMYFMNPNLISKKLNEDF